jgi:hypothetical protein
MKNDLDWTNIEYLGYDLGEIAHKQDFNLRHALLDSLSFKIQSPNSKNIFSFLHNIEFQLEVDIETVNFKKPWYEAYLP